jgi:hypothetical protein
VWAGCTTGEWAKFGRLFCRLNYSDVTENTYIQNLTFMEIMEREV